MPRIPSFAPTVEDSLIIGLSDLKKKWHPFHKAFETGWRTMLWKRGEIDSAQISYRISSLNRHEKTLYLRYKFEDEQINYSLKLVSIPSNLGRGVRWYFVCPATKKRCIKLICPPGEKHFLHREAFKGILYESQARSKSERRFNQAFGSYFDYLEIEEKVNQKYRKSHYQGKPTRLMKKHEELWEAFGGWFHSYIKDL